MGLKQCCIVDESGIYVDLFAVKTEQSPDGTTTETVLGYKLAEGERLLDALPPAMRNHAGSPGFVKPRWDEDAAAWVEGATEEEISSWEVEHPDPVSLEGKRAAKHAEVSAASEAAIEAGMGVETTHGTEHFSLTAKDQINLTTAKNAVDSGASVYPYHTDGVLCRIFTADEVRAIADAAVAHIVYHTTYCNHMFEWIRRADAQELQSIQYGADLPDDLAQHMQEVIAEFTSEV